MPWIILHDGVANLNKLLYPCCDFGKDITQYNCFLAVSPWYPPLLFGTFRFLLFDNS